MDAVILYVDCTDKTWQETYKNIFSIPIQENRFRDWGTLRYLFRGIEVYAPFIEKVHLVVASESQVPSWIDRNQVHIVLHKDIIPERFLPTFNSCTIETHIPFIEGLSEQFIYFNDDMFLLNPTTPELFFKNGRPQLYLRLREIESTSNIYRHQCHNSTEMARKALGLPSAKTYLFPPHWCHPMLRSLCLEVLKSDPVDFERRLSRLRTKDNVNQYLFLDYMYLKGAADNIRPPYSYTSFKNNSINDVCDLILHSPTKLLCINDNGCSATMYPVYKQMILSAFSEKFPKKSKYELENQ